mmetsp:Transcript_65583/g.156806  ORF Transcript_65583/g.156806 Transcript_65583/m.156806 type:complete len:252 (-) Transcript_65583:33-788(-)
MATGHALGDPERTTLSSPGCRGRIVGNSTADVEDPSFPRAIHQGHGLPGTAIAGILAIEAVLGTKLTHGLDRTASSLASLQGDGHEIPNAEKGSSTIRHSFPNQEGGARGLAQSQAMFIHQAIGGFPKCIGLVHLRYPTELLGCCDAGSRLVLLRARRIHNSRISAPDRIVHNPFGVGWMVFCWDIGHTPIAIGAVVRVGCNGRAVGHSVCIYDDASAAIDVKATGAGEQCEGHRETPDHRHYSPAAVRRS